MTTSRRDLLHLALAAGALAATKGVAGARTSPFAPQNAAPKTPLKILILGGTGFLGPAIVRAAQPHGAVITLFNRGKTRTELFPDLEKLQGDRDPKKGEGIKALEGRKWDVVFDDCGYYPRMVKASAELLAPNVGHYVFISSISAYANNNVPGEDESGVTGKMADETVETMGASFENYGPLKVLCEQAAEKAAPGRTTIVRPGYIVGPEDPTDRFTYWPVRFQKGGEIAVPGEAKEPIQVIDVRDLAEWLVMIAEKKIIGTFNATGPAYTMTWGETIAACQKVGAKDAKPVWIPWDFVQKQEGVEFPICIASVGEYAGFHTRSVKKAIAAGLKFRPIDVTVADTLAWWDKLPDDRKAKLRAGLSAEAETKLLAAWAASKGG